MFTHFPIVTVDFVVIDDEECNGFGVLKLETAGGFTRRVSRCHYKLHG